MKTVCFSTLISFFFTTAVFCQSEVIYLKNPSFEDYPSPGKAPVYWNDCGFKGESPVDTHPSGVFNVINPPKEGKTYLGMVTRDNDTYESVGQKLSSPLIAGQCYLFKINLCQSDNYISLSRLTLKSVNYITPIKLVITGGNEVCERLEVLVESEVVNHLDWKEYFFSFIPSSNYAYLQLNTYFNEPVLGAYNGNLLIDEASSIIPFSCDSINAWGFTDYQAVFYNDTIDYKSFVKTKSTNKDSSKNLTDLRVDEPINAIYFNSNLTDEERKKAIEEMITFIKQNPLIKANVIIEEEKKKTSKEQIKAIKKILGKHQINEYACRFTIL